VKKKRQPTPKSIHRSSPITTPKSLLTNKTFNDCRSNQPRVRAPPLSLFHARGGPWWGFGGCWWALQWAARPFRNKYNSPLHRHSYNSGLSHGPREGGGTPHTGLNQTPESGGPSGARTDPIRADHKYPTGFDIFITVGLHQLEDRDSGLGLIFQSEQAILMPHYIQKRKYDHFF
jgi:hypothetical protein